MSENDLVKKRRELVFVYSVKNANPNGDPDDENRPRTDIEGYNIVSDVRLKRTIRDYLKEQGNQILVRREFTNEDEIKNMEDLIIQSLGDSPSRTTIYEKLPGEFIDVRLFGATAVVSGANCSLTGPVQFSIGKSLNIPTISTIPITSVMSAGEKKAGGAMGAFHIVDYSLIAFEGVICPHLAEFAKLTKEDLLKLFEGMWKGTKTLNTRTKFNHLPRLLLSFRANNEEFIIGDLAYKLKIDGESPDFTIILDDLFERIDKFRKIDALKLEAVEYNQDPEIKLSFRDKLSNSFAELWQEKFKDISIEKIQLN
jgi:CRISPR-associated protein Csh2